jgi:MOSC domain-containing protein YiiM
VFVKSVNVGQRRTQMNGNQLETTGIYKASTREGVEISRLGMAQDFIADKNNHGGPDQAFYVSGTTDHEWWSRELDCGLEPGEFGENLTITGLQSAQYGIGERLQVGRAILEVTAPRFPCSTLAARMRDSEFVKKYRRAERPGLYCRVIEAGTLQAGHEAILQRHPGETISVRKFLREHFERRKSEKMLRRALAAPISIRARRDLERDLRKLPDPHGAGGRLS